jgi:hypothetical protein
MVVAMTRANCVRLYDALRALPHCPEIKVVMTGDLGKDPEEWSAAGHLTTKAQRDAIKKRMIDPDDPLKMVIVCDMWLTGTDIPCLHTLYIDKPMRGHNMIQAISRVNRVFRDKPHGLIVDYIGIGDELREATNRYSQGGGEGEPAPDIGEKARPLFFQCLEKIQKLLPDTQAAQVPKWRGLSRVDLEDLYAFVYGFLVEVDEREVAMALKSQFSGTPLSSVEFIERTPRELEKSVAAVVLALVREASVQRAAVNFGSLSLEIIGEDVTLHFIAPKKFVVKTPRSYLGMYSDLAASAGRIIN